MNNEKYGTTAIVLAVVAILLAASGLYLGYNAEKGDTGDQGLQGVAGVVGLVGPPGMNGTDGKDGSQGPKGENGTDCPPNELPIVTLNNIGGTYTYHHHGYYHHEYVFTINVSIGDPEDDNMHITFYWREDEADPWTKNDEYIGGDGTYTSEEDFWHCYWHGDETLYWLVETWDGSDIGLDYYNYTIVP